jgi:PRC-barrel domain
MADLPTQRDFEDFSAWPGREVVTPDGERLGAVELIFLDEATEVPEWVLVRLGEEDPPAFVPLAGAKVEERAIRVEQDRERVAAAPRLDVDKTLTIAEVRQLYDHYGLAYSEQESPTVLPDGATAGSSEPQTEERPRLRKYIGAPVPPASDGEPAADVEPAAGPEPAADREPGADRVPAASAPPVPIPGPAPKAIPPEGGFQAQPAGDDDSRGGPLALLTKKRALPVVLAGGIAALIGVLALRRRR